jgi:protoporphyrinogen oxidase
LKSFYDLTAAGLNEQISFPGEKFTNLKNGYSKLIEILKSNISATSIKLNHKVTLIDWSNLNEIVLNVFDSTRRANVKYQADVVLITLPLGVLKNNYKSMFIPSLPIAKANAIDKLGFGSINKIFIVFDKPLFKSDDTGFQLYWRPDQPISLPIVDQKCSLTVIDFFYIPY